MLGDTISEAGLVDSHVLQPWICILSAEGLCRLSVNQDNEYWPIDPVDECSLPQHRNHSGWYMQISESLFFHSRILR